MPAESGGILMGAHFWEVPFALMLSLGRWDNAPSRFQCAPGAGQVRTYMKRDLNYNLSGNEVYYTACSLLVTFKIRGVNFIARKI